VASSSASFFVVVYVGVAFVRQFTRTKEQVRFFRGTTMVVEEEGFLMEGTEILQLQLLLKTFRRFV
jgi:hypothetical protein